MGIVLETRVEKALKIRVESEVDSRGVGHNQTEEETGRYV